MRKEIKLTKDKKEHMMNTIKRYFSEERDEELGDLASNLILHFITEELGPEYYNQGVYDAHRYMSDRCEDMLSIEMK